VADPLAVAAAGLAVAAATEALGSGDGVAAGAISAFSFDPVAALLSSAWVPQPPARRLRAPNTTTNRRVVLMPRTPPSSS
jgi:hypothetical protein